MTYCRPSAARQALTRFTIARLPTCVPRLVEIMEGTILWVLDMARGTFGALPHKEWAVRMKRGREDSGHDRQARGLRAFFRLPRPLAESILVWAQGQRWYRAVGRHLATRLTIVEATDNDMVMIRRHFDPPPSSLFIPRDPETARWVAKYRSRVLGYAELVHDCDEHSPWAGYWLSHLWVRSLYRGLGLGERLARHGIEQTQLRGAHDLLLIVSEENESSIHLYDKLGFERVVVSRIEPILHTELEKVGRRHVAMRKPLDRLAAEA